jgi:hypothetical protein
MLSYGETRRRIGGSLISGYTKATCTVHSNGAAATHNEKRRAEKIGRRFFVGGLRAERAVHSRSFTTVVSSQPTAIQAPTQPVPIRKTSRQLMTHPAFQIIVLG